jgi:hypothetical protein
LNDKVTLLYIEVYLQNKKVNEYSTKDFIGISLGFLLGFHWDFVRISSRFYLDFIRISLGFHLDFTRNYPRILLNDKVSPLYIDVYLQNKQVNEYSTKDFIRISLRFHSNFIRISLGFN